MSSRKYHSPDAPGLKYHELDDGPGNAGYAGYSPQIKQSLTKKTAAQEGSSSKQYSRASKVRTPATGGHQGVVGHQQYGNWHEQNNFFHPSMQGPPQMDQQNHYPMMNPNFQPPQGGNYYATDRPKKRVLRPNSASGTKKYKRNRNLGDISQSQQFAQQQQQQLMMPPANMMTMPQMAQFGMAPQFMPMHTPMGGGVQSAFGMSTMSDAGGLTTATSQNQSVYEETERKNKAKIDLLEKKIKAKDQLFEDALASTVASSCGCGGQGMENRSLTAELKRRLLKLKGRYAEAEAEITRLSKTVKIVEVEVNEDTEPLRDIIQQLKDEKFDLASINTRQTDTLSDQRLRIEELERERSKVMLDGERTRSEITLLNEKIRSMEEEQRFKGTELESAQLEIRNYRESFNNFEIQISQLQSQLSESSLYKDWYEEKLAEVAQMQKQVDEYQNSCYTKDDEIMSLNDKLQQENENGEELKSMIKDLHEQIRELEQRPEAKADSSSSDHDDGELEQWKSKYEAADKDCRKLRTDYERMEHKKQSEIDELQQSFDNMQKRAIDLNAEVARLKRLLAERTEFKSGDHQSSEHREVIVQKTIIHESHKSEDKSSKGKKKESERSRSVGSKKGKRKQRSESSRSSSVESDYSSESKDKKKKKSKKSNSKKQKKGKSKRKQSSSSSSYSSSSKEVIKSETPERKDDIDIPKSDDEKPISAPILGENFNKDAGATAAQALREEIDALKGKEQMLLLEVDELRISVQSYELKEQERLRDNNLATQLQGVAKDALYKTKYEESQKRYQAQQVEFDNQLSVKIKILTEKEAELLEIVRLNETQIKTVTESQTLNVEGKVIINKIDYQVLEKKVYLDRHIIEASDKAKVTVLERERALIKRQFEKLYKKEVMALEANILAYQDLLITKEFYIKKLEKEALEKDTFDKNVLEVEIANLKRVLEEKLTIIEELRSKGNSDLCADHQSDDELTSGNCTRVKLNRRVFKKIEHLNKYIRNEVTPEIHDRYAVEIQNLHQKHINEMDKLTNEHRLELRRNAQIYEAKISQNLIEINKLEGLNHSKDAEISIAEKRLSDADFRAEEQAKALDQLVGENRSMEVSHKGELGRLQGKHSMELEEALRKYQYEMQQSIIERESLEQTIKQLSQNLPISQNNGGDDSALLQREVNQLKQELAQRLRNEQRYDQTLIEKDSQINQLLDHKKQFNAAKFAKLEDLIDLLSSEKANLKAKYKTKIHVKTESIRADIGAELHKTKAMLDRKSETLDQRLIELEIMYTRVEELEMSQSTNSVEVEDIHRRYKLITSQLKSDHGAQIKAMFVKIEDVQLVLQRQNKKSEESYINQIEEYKAREKVVQAEEKHKYDAREFTLKSSYDKEIERLTHIINLYKDKLTRKESENRNLFVDLKIYKDRENNIKADSLGELQVLRSEITHLHTTLELTRTQYENEITVLQTRISELEQFKMALETENNNFIYEINQLKAELERRQLEIDRLTRELSQRDLRIKELLRMIDELNARKVTERTVIVSQPIREEQESLVKTDVHVDENVEDQYRIVQRVATTMNETRTFNETRGFNESRESFKTESFKGGVDKSGEEQ